MQKMPQAAAALCAQQGPARHVVARHPGLALRPKPTRPSARRPRSSSSSKGRTTAAEEQPGPSLTNGSVQAAHHAGLQPPEQPQQDASASWDASADAASGDEDWQGSKPWSLKDVDWGEPAAAACMHAQAAAGNPGCRAPTCAGLAGLAAVILALSFGAYRVLHHFRERQQH